MSVWNFHVTRDRQREEDGEDDGGPSDEGDGDVRSSTPAVTSEAVGPAEPSNDTIYVSFKIIVCICELKNKFLNNMFKKNWWYPIFFFFIFVY